MSHRYVRLDQVSDWTPTYVKLQAEFLAQTPPQNFPSCLNFSTVGVSQNYKPKKRLQNRNLQRKNGYAGLSNYNVIP